ncbi:MAG: hypothetical protein L3J31_06730 [Bacteroidales bacterium]|nr:hypothetical protein [Bacteroidales bacterium]MCF6342483.1 hypothetical protein [Bacteroidales bacterium]
MMNKRFFSPAPLILLLFFTACSPHPKEVFETLKQLDGHWKSKGNVIVYESWTLENDSLLTGYQFAERGGNKLVLERYRLERDRDSILFVILHTGKLGAYRYPLVETLFGSFNFENQEAVYPNRILIDFENDSVFTKRKENSRGKKGIEFEMKRWKE